MGYCGCHHSAVAVSIQVTIGRGWQLGPSNKGANISDRFSHVPCVSMKSDFPDLFSIKHQENRRNKNWEVLRKKHQITLTVKTWTTPGWGWKTRLSHLLSCWAGGIDARLFQISWGLTYVAKEIQLTFCSEYGGAVANFPTMVDVCVGTCTGSGMIHKSHHSVQDKKGYPGYPHNIPINWPIKPSFFFCTTLPLLHETCDGLMAQVRDGVAATGRSPSFHFLGWLFIWLGPIPIGQNSSIESCVSSLYAHC